MQYDTLVHYTDLPLQVNNTTDTCMVSLKIGSIEGGGY